MPGPIPADLLQTVEVTCPAFRVEGDVGACLVRQAAGLQRANGQIEAIARIARATGPQ